MILDKETHKVLLRHVKDYGKAKTAKDAKINPRTLLKILNREDVNGRLISKVMIALNKEAERMKKLTQKILEDND